MVELAKCVRPCLTASSDALGHCVRLRPFLGADTVSRTRLEGICVPGAFETRPQPPLAGRDLGETHGSNMAGCCPNTCACAAKPYCFKALAAPWWVWSGYGTATIAHDARAWGRHVGAMLDAGGAP